MDGIIGRVLTDIKLGTRSGVTSRQSLKGNELSEAGWERGRGETKIKMGKAQICLIKEESRKRAASVDVLPTVDRVTL